MDLSRDRPDLDSAVRDLAARLTAVEERLGLLERHGVAPRPADAPAVHAPDAASPPHAGRAASAETLALIGRTLLALAGAFLLRAMTVRPGESGSGPLPLEVGTTLGVAYALLWIVLAHLAARRGRRSAAAFHALAGGLIVFPLVWEATVQFRLLPPPVSLGILLAITAVGLGIAFVGELRSLAWIFGFGAAATALAIAVPTTTLALSASFLLILGLAALWLAYARGWYGLAWTLAGFADATLLLMTAIALLGRDPERVAEHFSTGSLVALQLALVLVYCVGFGVHTLTRNKDVGIGEIVQAAAALAIGLGGAVAVTRATGTATAPLGVVCLLLAAGAYGVSFTFLDRRAGIRANFIFYSTLALCLTFPAFAELIRGAWLAPMLAAIAVVMAWIGAARARATLSGHGAFYAVAAIVVSGVGTVALEALAGSAVPPISALTPAQLAALAGAAVCSWFPIAAHGRTWGRLSPLPKFVLLVPLAAGLGGALVVLLAPLLAAAPADPARIAVLRTGILAGSALLLARIGRTTRLGEASWLVYPVLVAGAVKLVAEDLPHGRPATLVASLALYGGALILAPRWVRLSGRP